jgi:hypothetical protein
MWLLPGVWETKQLRIGTPSELTADWFIQPYVNERAGAEGDASSSVAGSAILAAFLI